MKKYLIPILLSIVLGSGFAQESDSAPNDYPEKKQGRDTWEYIVNAPGYVVMIPVWGVDYALIPVSYAITETKIIEKTIDFLTSDDGTRGVFPVYDSRIGAGASYYHMDLLTQGSVLRLVAAGWSGGRQSLQMQVNNIRLFGPVVSSLAANYFNYTDEPFYGVGNSIPDDYFSKFSLKQINAKASLGLQLNRYNAFSTTFGYEKDRISESEEPGEPLLSETFANFPGSLGGQTGLFESVHLVYSELQYQHDSRNSKGNPSKGWELLVKGGLFKQADGGQYGFYRGVADVTKYFHLFYNRVLAVRAAGQITTSYDNGVVPFYYLSELGHRETIRGYQRGRFREKDKVLGSVEYRFPILKRYRTGREAASIDMVLFMDSGKVAPDISDDFSSDFHNTFGFGFRVYNSKSLFMQFYSGYSDDGVRMYFVLN